MWARSGRVSSLNWVLALERSKAEYTAAAAYMSKKREGKERVSAPLRGPYLLSSPLRYCVDVISHACLAQLAGLCAC